MIEQSWFKSWLETLLCVLGQDILPSQCLSTPGCTKLMCTSQLTQQVSLFSHPGGVEMLLVTSSLLQKPWYTSASRVDLSFKVLLIKLDNVLAAYLTISLQHKIPKKCSVSNPPEMSMSDNASAATWNQYLLFAFQASYSYKLSCNLSCNSTAR